MPLSYEEIEALRKVLPILEKIVNENYLNAVSETAPFYGIGTPDPDGSGEWMMWDGPMPYLEKMVATHEPPYETHTGPFYIVQLETDYGYNVRLYRWNKEELKWKKLKQKS